MTDLELFRHTLAALAYRAGKVLRDAPPEFANFGEGRTAGQILAHMADLMDWSISLCEGQQRWQDSPVLPWDQGTARFFAALEKLDGCLAAPIQAPLDRLFQGPIADALTHVGQLAMMRRMAQCPMRGENYYVAEIAIGRVGLQQAKSVREFS